MKIYLDYLFIENFLTTIIIIKEVEFISKERTKIFRTMLSGCISSIYILIMLLMRVQCLEWIIFKLFLSFAIVYTAFNPKQLNKYIKCVGIYYLVSILNIGVVITTKTFLNTGKGLLTNTLIYVFSFVIGIIIMKFFWKMFKYNLRLSNLIYEVTIPLGGQKMKYVAFLDTGNLMYYNLPVILAEKPAKEPMEEIKKDKVTKEIEIKTLNGYGKHIAYEFKGVEIRNNNHSKKVNVDVVFLDEKMSKDSQYNMILNINIFEDSLGGIII